MPSLPILPLRASAVPFKQQNHETHANSSSSDDILTLSSKPRLPQVFFCLYVSSFLLLSWEGSLFGLGEIAKQTLFFATTCEFINRRFSRQNLPNNRIVFGPRKIWSQIDTKSLSAAIAQVCFSLMQISELNPNPINNRINRTIVHKT